MAVPSKAGKNIIEFNCKNGVYSVDGKTVKPLGYLTAISTEKKIDTKDIMGDGENILSLTNDKGSTGSLEMSAKDDDFEKDLGFEMEIEQGLAEVQVLGSEDVAIGAECYIIVKDKTSGKAVQKTKKVWWLNVNVSPAGTSLSQNTDTINESTASYPLTIKGVNLMGEDGITEYVDENGNTRKVFKISCLPDNANYATFLDTVPVPKAKASV
jgi:hypothetical protein